MERLREHLLAAAGLAGDDHRDLAVDQLLRRVDHVGHRDVALSDGVQRDLAGDAGRALIRLAPGGTRNGQLRLRLAELRDAHQVVEQDAVGSGALAQAPRARGTAGQLVHVAVDDVVERAADHLLAVGVAEQAQRDVVARDHLALPVERDQPLADLADVVGTRVEAEEHVLLELLVEQRVLDHAVGDVDQRHGVALAVARVLGARRGDVEHAGDVTEGIGDRRAGTGQARVIGAEVVVEVDRDRHALGQRGADAVGPLRRLAPVETEVEAGALEIVLGPVVGEEIDHHAVGVGEQDREAGTGDLAVEVLELGAGDAAQVLALAAAHLEQLLVEALALAALRFRV